VCYILLPYNEFYRLIRLLIQQRVLQVDKFALAINSFIS
jgi:hypothetical protein